MSSSEHDRCKRPEQSNIQVLSDQITYRTDFYSYRVSVALVPTLGEELAPLLESIKEIHHRKAQDP